MPEEREPKARGSTTKVIVASLSKFPSGSDLVIGIFCTLTENLGGNRMYKEEAEAVKDSEFCLPNMPL